MKTLKEIENYIQITLNSAWKRRRGIKVPSTQDLSLDNDAVEIEGAVLYTDLRNSTRLVNDYKDSFAAGIYKVFLKSTCDIIENNGGTITSFDGDRVMAVFIGKSKCSDAARTGLQICFIVNIINDHLPTGFNIDYATGIDVSQLFVIRTGIRGSNDLAWIGTAANIAAKLSEKTHPKGKTFITERLFKRLNEQSKFSTPGHKCMWSKIFDIVENESVFMSEWQWKF